MTLLNRSLRWLDRLFPLCRVEDARWLAIAQPMHLGDAVATLPLAGILKATWPELKICFIGRTYVQPLIDCCEHIDLFLESDAVIADPALLTRLPVDILLNPFPDRRLAAVAFQAGVPLRVGNLRRPNIWRYCNRFVCYSRRDYKRHEIDFNLEHLAGLGLPVQYPLTDISGYFGLTRQEILAAEIDRMLDPLSLNLVFHPKSNRNGREWPAGHYAALAMMLPAERFKLFITGVAAEGAELHSEVPELFALPNVVDLTGRLSLPQLFALLGRVDGLVASGTGPLHVAAAMGIHALGIFPPRDGIDPAHWGPVGRKGEYLCLPHRCQPGGEKCPADLPGGPCACTAAITPEQVMERLVNWGKNVCQSRELL